MIIEAKFNFGDLVEDITNGLQGIIVAVSYYPTGCIHYSLQKPVVEKKGELPKVPDNEWLDETYLKLVKAKKVKFTNRQAGGPAKNPKRSK